MNPINAIPSFNINLLLSYLEVHVEDKFASACMLQPVCLDILEPLGVS